MKHLPLLTVVPIDFLGITIPLVVIMITLRHTSRERLAQELTIGSLHVVHSSSTATAKIYWH